MSKRKESYLKVKCLRGMQWDSEHIHYLCETFDMPFQIMTENLVTFTQVNE